MAEYNGWPNYETWLVALWIDNDEEMQGYARSLADDASKLGADDLDPQGFLSEHYARPGNIEAGRVSRLADAIKGWLDEMKPDLGASVWSDMLGAAFEAVDWRRIAEHYMEMAVRP